MKSSTAEKTGYSNLTSNSTNSTSTRQTNKGAAVGNFNGHDVSYHKDKKQVIHVLGLTIKRRDVISSVVIGLFMLISGILVAGVVSTALGIIFFVVGSLLMVLSPLLFFIIYKKTTPKVPYGGLPIRTTGQVYNTTVYDSSCDIDCKDTDKTEYIRTHDYSKQMTNVVVENTTEVVAAVVDIKTGDKTNEIPVVVVSNPVNPVVENKVKSHLPLDDTDEDMLTNPKEQVKQQEGSFESEIKETVPLSKTEDDNSNSDSDANENNLLVKETKEENS